MQDRLPQRSEVDWAGAALVQDNLPEERQREARRLVHAWRMGHARALEAVFALICDIRSGLAAPDPGCHSLPCPPLPPLIVQRYKHMPSILAKLRRYPAMRLGSLHDMAGTRLVVGSMQEVR